MLFRSQRDLGLVLRDGDILFQVSSSSQSKAIQLATHSPYSHVGILVTRHGKQFVLEAEKGVELTPLEKWIHRDSRSHFVAKRVGSLDKTSTIDIRSCLRNTYASYLGKPYDWNFDWSDDRFYCSELVWKIFHQAYGLQIGKLRRLRDFDFSDPRAKAKLDERYGNRIPWDEPVISPVDIFNSDQVHQIFEQ